MKTDVPATGSSDVFFVSLAVPREVFVTGSKSCTESITLSMEAKKWARRYTVNAVVSTRHLPSRVLSSLCTGEAERLPHRANQPGHLAGKVQSHFGGGRGVRWLKNSF